MFSDSHLIRINMGTYDLQPNSSQDLGWRSEQQHQVNNFINIKLHNTHTHTHSSQGSKSKLLLLNDYIYTVINVL